MAIGALQTGYTTLYGKVAGLGTQNGQTRGSSFREHIDGTEKKAPYQHLAQNGTITYKGVTFVCDTDRNTIRHPPPFKLMFRHLLRSVTIMTAIAEDKRAQQMLLEKDEMESSVGEIITE